MDNVIINIEEKYIKYRFKYNDDSYLLICFQEEPTDEDEMYFVKEDRLDDETIIVRNIESDEEYEEVKREFQKQMLEIGDDEDGEI